MRKVILSALALIFSLGSAYAKDYKYQTVEGDPMQTRIYTLDNGLNNQTYLTHFRILLQTIALLSSCRMMTDNLSIPFLAGCQLYYL